jgi:hypothetical protein
MQKLDQVEWLRQNFAAMLPMEEQLATWAYAGHIQTSVETLGSTRQVLDFGHWNAVATYGTYRADHRTEQPSGTEKHQGRLLVAQVSPDEFVVTGADASVFFQLGSKGTGHAQILRVEEGRYEKGEWVPLRIWNGDQTDFGMRFRHTPVVLKVKMGTY